MDLTFWQLFWGDCGMCRAKYSNDVGVRPWGVCPMKFKLEQVNLCLV